ncbi:MAG: phosphate ABC transporter substrate-binding protein [Phycisphaerae bacterium]
MNRKPVWMIFVLLVASLVNTPGAAAAEPPIVIAGSERMAPLVRKLAQRYVELHPDVTIEVKGGGSGEGIEKLAKEAATIAALARPVTDDEIRLIRLMRRTDLVGIPIAMDAVVFFVSPENGLMSLTLEQINKIYTHKITTWEELGLPSHPSGSPVEKPIRRHVLALDSGSVKVVQRRAMHGKGYTIARIEHKVTRDVVNAVAADPLALGFGGMGYTSGVETVAVRKEAGSTAVFPTPETTRNREYPLAHYLYFYFAGQPSGRAKGFLRFIISLEGQAIVRTSGTGAVTLPMSTSRQ